MCDKSEQRGRSKKRPGSGSNQSDGNVSVGDDSYYNPLLSEEITTSPRSRSLSKRRKTEGTGQQKITEFTCSQSSESMEGHEEENEEGGENAQSKSNTLVAQLNRIEENTVENKKQYSALSGQMDKILSEIFELRKENDFLKKKIQTLEKRNENMADDIERLEKKLKTEKEMRNNLEQYTRKDNLKIFNLPGDCKTETSDVTEKKVVELIQKELKLLSFQQDHISVAHRVGVYRNNNRPVIVRLTRKVKA